MHNSYKFNDEGKIIVNSSNSEDEIRDNHNKVQEELELENAIEVLNEELLSKESENIMPLEAIPRCRRVSKFLAFASVASMFAVSFLDPYISMIAKVILGVAYTSGLAIANLLIDNKYDEAEKQTLINSSAIKLLIDEIAKKEEELKLVKDNINGSLEVDQEVHELDTVSCRKEIRDELCIIRNYVKYLLNGGEEKDSKKALRVVPKDKQEMVLKYVNKDAE